MADANIDAENEDSWLYGSENGKPAETSENQQEPPQHASSWDANDKNGPTETSLTTDHAVNGSVDQLDTSKESVSIDVKNKDNVNDEDGDADDHHNNNNVVGNDSEENDDSEDDVCVTIGDVRIQTYDAPLGKFQGPPVAGPTGGTVANHMMMGPSAKPPSKGVDMDAMGSVRGVNIYEFDLNSIKIDEKPWRKPGADITDYFNYGFTEDTWMKYCEKQRRMRVENNCRSGLIVGNGQLSGDLGAGDLDSTYLGVTRRQSGQRQPAQGGMGVAGKQTGVIDVIGGTLRDSRRPQQDYITDAATSQSPATSVSAVMPISMSVPPPMLNMPLPDFALPPPSSLPPGAMGHPVIGPPHGLLGHPPLIVAPPPNFAPPPLPGHQFDPFFRPSMIGGPPPNAINHGDRRGGVPGFTDRPPYRMENLYGVPPPFPTNMPPPHWDTRKLPGHPDERPPQWRREGSRSRESEISSSSTEETRGKSREKYEPSERKSPAFSTRGESRQRSRDKSSRRDYERDRGRDRERDRERERERRRERDYEVSRSRHHSRHHSNYRDEDRSSRHYSSSKRRERSPQDDYYPSASSSRHQSKKHRHDRSPSSSASSEKERKKSRSTSTEDHKK